MKIGQSSVVAIDILFVKLVLRLKDMFAVAGAFHLHDRYYRLVVRVGGST